MTTFRVGQRVRIKHGLPNSRLRCLEGKEGVLIGRSAMYPEGWYVDINGNHSLLSGRRYCINECRLEPATDANTFVSWESMRDLWVPEHLRAEA